MKIPQDVDRHVGSRVRMRRMMVGMSQEKLGDSCSITFQQIQKYEKGTNRIGASRLHQIARILEVPVNFQILSTSWQSFHGRWKCPSIAHCSLQKMNTGGVPAMKAEVAAHHWRAVTGE